MTFDWLAATWEEGCAEVARFADKLGAPIDTGIFDTVVALNLLGMTTYQSCEGHLDHGCPYPWVTLVDAKHEARTLVPWQQLCALKNEAQAVGTLEAHDAYIMARNAFNVQNAPWERDDCLLDRVGVLLDAFYDDRKASPIRLVVKRMNPAHTRIEIGCAREIRKMSETLKASYLERSRTEMRAFTVFLFTSFMRQRIERG